VVTYAYDRDSHVTSLSYGSLGSLTYGYDADGHRTSVGGGFAYTNIPAAISSISYNADNSPALINGSAGVSNDNDGDITCIGGNTCPEFSYDSRGHLQQWEANPYTINYSYDAFGRRTERNVGGLVSGCYIYDGLNPVSETGYCDSSLGVTNLLEGMGLDELFLSSNGSTPISYLRDALNSTIGLVNSSGSLTDQTLYDPYGNTTDTVSSQASAFEFTGRENEGGGFSATNLYYMRGRYYNPAIGRFISRDPAGLSGGTNLYEYAGDDPVDLSDPSGLDLDSTLEGPGDVCGTCFHAQGAFANSGPPALTNTDGLDRAVPLGYDGSQNGGGLSSPLILAQEDEEEDENPQSPEGWGKRQIEKSIEAVETLDEMGRPGWAHTAGGFVNWLRNLQNPNVSLTPEQADAVVREARKLGVDVRLDQGHPRTRWNVPHLNLGVRGQVHLRVPQGYALP
jgi:RHS repeat-associated protein